MTNEGVAPLKPRPARLRRTPNRFPLFLAVVATFFLSACGASSGGSSSTTVVITGSLSGLAKAKPSIDGSAASYATASIAWAGATVQVVDTSGKVIGTGTVNADGTYSVSVAPGSNYIIRVQSGNLVLKAFVQTVSSATSVNVTATTTAEVIVLAQVLGVASIGEPGVDVAAAFSSVNVEAVVVQITASPNLAALATTLATNIAASYDGTATTVSLGAADATVSAAVTVVSSVVSTTAVPATPSPPKDVVATADDHQVTLTWTAVTGATSYNVRYRTAPNVTIANGTKVANATSGAAITGLTNFKKYYFVVTAVNAGGESALSSEVSAIPQIPVAVGTWTTKTAMPDKSANGEKNQRDNAANVVLNGIVYVLAGAPAGVGILSSMMAYDPATDIWTEKAALPAWSTISIQPPWTGSIAGPPSYRYGPAAAAVNGVIYLIGGTSMVNGGGPIYPIAVYDPSTDAWSPNVPGTATALAPIPTGRWGFDVAVIDGLIYAIGGGVQVPGGTTKTSMDVVTKTGAVSGTPITGLTNGTNYSFIVTAVSGGTESADSFEVSATPLASYAAGTAGTAPVGLSTAAGSGQVTVSWTAVTSATSYNVYYGTKPGVTVTTGTKVSVTAPTVTSTVTGLTNTPKTKYYFIVTSLNGATESVASDEVSTTPKVTPAATVPSAVAATGGDAQVTLTWTAVAGATSYNVYYGTAVNIYYGNVEVYDPVANTWTTKAAMPTPRWGSTVSVVNGLIYAIGGWGGWPELSLVEVYDPATNTWSTTVPTTTATTTAGTAGAALAPMPTARDDFGFAVLNGVIYAMGGDINTFNAATLTPCCTKVVEAYDPVANAWATKTSMPTMRDDFDASTVDGVIYAIAGSRDGLFPVQSPPLDAAWLAANEGGYSLTIVEAFSISSIPVPKGLTATASGTQVVLGWSGVTGATSYNIYWSNKAGVSTTANSTKIANGTSIAYTHTGLTAGTWYYYVVTAVTSAGESLPSNEVAVKP